VLRLGYCCLRDVVKASKFAESKLDASGAKLAGPCRWSHLLSQVTISHARIALNVGFVLTDLYSESSSSSSSLSSSLSLPLSCCWCKKSIKAFVFSLTFFMSSFSLLFSPSHHWKKPSS
jgi:hypothetical protein